MKNKLKKRLKQKLNEQIYQPSLTGNCSSTIAATINTQEELLVIGAEYGQPPLPADASFGMLVSATINSLMQLANNLPVGSTIKIAADVMTSISPWDPANNVQADINNQSVGNFPVYEPMMDNFATYNVNNIQYYFLHNDDAGIYGSQMIYPGVGWCTYNGVDMNAISGMAGSTGNIPNCDDPAYSYHWEIVNNPGAFIAGCETGDFSGMPMQSNPSGGQAGLNNQQSYFSFYCQCPQYQFEDYDPHTCSAGGVCVPTPNGTFNSLAECEASGCAPTPEETTCVDLEMASPADQAAICNSCTQGNIPPELAQLCPCCDEPQYTQVAQLGAKPSQQQIGMGPGKYGPGKKGAQAQRRMNEQVERMKLLAGLKKKK